MRCTRLFVCLLLAWLAMSGTAAHAEGEPPRLAAGKAYRGISIGAPAVGRAVTADEIDAFVRACAIDVVVIDVGWPGERWAASDAAAIEALAARLRRGGVVVAAMFHPGLAVIAEAKVQLARAADGKVAADHAELCFAAEDAVAWGTAWGDKILAACPSIDHVVLRDVRASCVCEKCAGAAGETRCAEFVRTCRERWTKTRPAVRVGHAGAALEYAKDVDFALPLVAVRREDAATAVDAAKLVREVAALRATAAATPSVPFVQATWDAAPGSTTDDVVAVLRAADDHGTGFVLASYEALLHAPGYDAAAIVTALGGDPTKLAQFLGGGPAAPPKGDPRAWVWFESRETPNPPALALIAANGSARTVAPDADTLLISGIPDQPRGRFHQLAVSLGDSNRSLLRFRLKSGRPARAELRWKMHLADVAPTEAFDIAIHAVTETWTEAEACWAEAPKFDATPSVVARVEPKEGEVRIDVSALVAEWASGARENHGILVKVARPVAPGRPARPQPR